MQELVHEDAQGLHLGERIVVPPLEIEIDFGKVVIELDQTQASIIKDGTQARAPLVRHGRGAVLLFTRSIRCGLDPGQLDPLRTILVATGIANLRQDRGGRNRPTPGTERRYWALDKSDRLSDMAVISLSN